MNQKSKKYKNVMLEIIIFDEPDIVTASSSDDGGIDFEDQEGWSLGTF